jgi:hypothetical protein
MQAEFARAGEAVGTVVGQQMVEMLRDNVSAQVGQEVVSAIREASAQSGADFSRSLNDAANNEVMASPEYEVQVAGQPLGDLLSNLPGQP